MFREHPEVKGFFNEAHQASGTQGRERRWASRNMVMEPKNRPGSSGGRRSKSIAPPRVYGPTRTVPPALMAVTEEP